MRSISLPVNACDCHMHLFDPAYPAISNASLNPPAASLADYGQVQQQLGVSRFVIVQPSIYGLDNALLMKTLRESSAGQVRGVAVVDDKVSDELLADLYLSGVRGVRFNQVQHGVTTMDMLEALDGRLSERAMHIQLHARPDLLIASERRLLSLTSTVVIDHLGRLASMPQHRRDLEVVLYQLLDSGKVWLKLSGPYLASASGAPYEDIADFIRGLIVHFPERLVWGSDWPHATEKEPPDNVAMLGGFHALMPEALTEQRIFTDNPAALYGFTRPM